MAYITDEEKFEIYMNDMERHDNELRYEMLMENMPMSESFRKEWRGIYEREDYSMERYA